jgi:hypothetical protein
MKEAPPFSEAPASAVAQISRTPEPSPDTQHPLTCLCRAAHPPREPRSPLHARAVYDPAKGGSEYRVPDLVFAAPDRHSERGVEGGAAELIIEILSPNDESRDKLTFCACVGAQEVWLVEPDTRAVEFFVLRAGTYHVALPDSSGIVHSPALAVDLSTIPGPRLRISRVGQPEEAI